MSKKNTVSLFAKSVNTVAAAPLATQPQPLEVRIVILVGTTSKGDEWEKIAIVSPDSVSYSKTSTLRMSEADALGLEYGAAERFDVDDFPLVVETKVKRNGAQYTVSRPDFTAGIIAIRDRYFPEQAAPQPANVNTAAIGSPHGARITTAKLSTWRQATQHSGFEKAIADQLATKPVKSTGELHDRKSIVKSNPQKALIMARLSGLTPTQTPDVATQTPDVTTQTPDRIAAIEDQLALLLGALSGLKIDGLNS